MKKIGVLFGVENTFPGALVEKINSMGIDGVCAEFVHLGGVRMAQTSGYAVIVDRVSHDMPFYRAFLKNAMLTGTQVINNPFWWSADDKFFNYSLASRLGVAVPPTVLLPHKQLPPGISDRSLRNLEYPLDWDGIFEHIGFPAFLKPFDGGGWRDVFHVHNRQDFFAAYDQSRDLCMMLQKAIDFTDYFRCFVVGQQKVRIMSYDPRRPHAERYLMDPPAYNRKLLRRVEKDALTLCRALGYDLNTVEFAVHNGIPYAIDFMNPAPDADLHSIGREHFHWVVDAIADLAVKKAKASEKFLPELRWAVMLNGQTSAPSAKKEPLVTKKAAAKKAAAKKPAILPSSPIG